MVLETKIEIINLKRKELLGIEETLLADFVIWVEDIEAICQTVEDEDAEISDRLCGIYTKAGEYFRAYTPFDVVKKMWYDYKLNRV